MYWHYQTDTGNKLECIPLSEARKIEKKVGKEGHQYKCVKCSQTFKTAAESKECNCYEWDK
jgi:hypothetical protein